MWRGYPHALGVYLYINCRVWASRKSATTGKFFSNDKMDEHIQTFNFGKNEQGKIVYSMEQSDDDEEEEQKAAGAEPKSQTDEEKKVELPAAVIDAANAAFAPAAAAAAGAAAPAASAVAAAAGVPVAAAAAAGAAPARSGSYVDGIRIPWWVRLACRF